MSLLRNKLKSNFSQIPNALITDSELSGTAFRIVVYLFSKPDKWEVNNTDIQKRFNIKRRETMSKYWKEIVMSGWVTRERKTDSESGKMVAGFDYTLHSIPCTEKADTQKADTHATVYGSDRVRINRTLSNTDSFSNTNNKKQQKETPTAIGDSKKFKQENYTHKNLCPDAWLLFCKYRREVKTPLKTEYGCKPKAELLSKFSFDIQMLMVQQTMKKEWTDIFEVKNLPQKNQQYQTASMPI